ncbi:GDSL esterase/lipase [Spatholobus suberectus]|nr:GDSL esterase/lipase [Spatholobus suberectus]
MDCETKLWLVVLFFFSATYMQHCVVGEPQVPCLFIFGDSLSDSGNNNKLRTDARVNYLPYGIDFPSGPTGRFTNGRTAVDIISNNSILRISLFRIMGCNWSCTEILRLEPRGPRFKFHQKSLGYAQLLGLDDFIPPFANTGASDILKGVNYASGAAGIRKETGTHLGEDICLGLQLQNHKVIVSQITEKLGSADQAQQHLNKCLYYVNIGNNDYLNNYFLPEHYQSSRTYSPDQYAAALAQEYSMHLKDLHALGARKFALIGLGLIGCVPHEISIHGKNGSICVEEESNAALLFNDKLKAVVDRYNEELFDAKFIFINSAVVSHQTLQLPLPKDVIICCKVGSNGQCIPNEEPCRNRNLYPFFDEFHPTEIVNQAIARSAYNAPIPTYAHPMDISHLVKL